MTAAGFLSRLIGFFFRIFLSHAFGEEQVGLYQLIFPIYALCFSLTTAGIETALARSIAQKVSLKKQSEIPQLVYIGIAISLLLTCLAAFSLQKSAFKIALYILGDIRCESLLIAISYALPFAAVHSCICGYYFGLKQTKIPALSQLIEQICRVVSVYIIYQIFLFNHGQIQILFAVIGIVAGEISSSLFCVRYFCRQINPLSGKPRIAKLCGLSRELLSLSIPLTSSRVLLNLLQSIESISIPIQLQLFGYTSSEALGNYGVLTGMAFPCIFFPTAITNSVSTMLLPTVAEIQAAQNFQKLKRLIEKVCFLCVSMGSVCCLIFVCLGNWIGTLLFHSALAGKYLQTLAWICPFLYMNTTLLGIVNGLGKPNISLIINVLSLTIRIFSVIILIPFIGMNGYLWGLLLSHCLTSVSSLLYLLFFFRRLTLHGECS